MPAVRWSGCVRLGRVVLPITALDSRHRSPKTISSPGLGQHNAQVYGDWFGYNEQDLESLKRDGVILATTRPTRPGSAISINLLTADFSRRQQVRCA